MEVSELSHEDLGRFSLMRKLFQMRIAFSNRKTAQIEIIVSQGHSECRGAGRGAKVAAPGKASAGFGLRPVHAVIAVAPKNMGCVNSPPGPRIPCF